MPDRQTPNIAAAGDALMASLAPSLPTPLEAELADKLAAARRLCESLEMENERLRADLSLVRRIVHRLTEGVPVVPQNQAPAEGAAPAPQGANRQVAGVEGPAGSVAPAGQPGEVAR